MSVGKIEKKVSIVYDGSFWGSIACQKNAEGLWLQGFRSEREVGEKGRFDVLLNGEIVFSKKAMGRYPYPFEINRLLGKRFKLHGSYQFLSSPIVFE